MPKRTKAQKKAKKTEVIPSLVTVPTVSAVRGYPALEEYVVKKLVDGVEEVATFRKDDCVFVAHVGLEGGHSDNGHHYFKMRLQSFHQDNGGTVWAIGHWFYSPDDLRGVALAESDVALIERMGNTELVASNDLAVIEADCIEYRCVIHAFDDKGTTGPVITARSWFTRLKLVLGPQPFLSNATQSCVCKSLYTPVLDNQRYCPDCQQWFDEGCILRIGRRFRVKGETALACIRQVPYMRGWEGDEVKDWMTVGTGLKLALVDALENEVAAEGRTVEEQWADWSDRLSEDFVKFVRETSFARFQCPSCGASI